MLRGIVLGVALLACQSRGPFVMCLCADGGPEPAFTCLPSIQVGCGPTEKCTWIVDQVQPVEVGHIGCVPLDGTEVTFGESCAGGIGSGGSDNCDRYGICQGGTCRAICDPGDPSSCFAGSVCVEHPGVFVDNGLVQAGICDP